MSNSRSTVVRCRSRSRNDQQLRQRHVIPVGASALQSLRQNLSRLSLPMQSNQSASLSLIGQKRKSEISREESCFESRIAIFERGFGTACFNESITDHRRVIDGRTEI